MLRAMGAAVELINGWVWPVAAAPFIGSFLGVVVRRLPAGRGIVAGRSACEACGHTLSPLEMVPVVSFLALRGRCRACGAPIAPAHLGIELAALAVAVSAALVVQGGPFLWAGCVFGWFLLTLGWIDANTFRLPDVLTLPLIVLGLAEAAWMEPDRLTSRAIAAVAGFGALWLLATFYRLLRKREGLGLGDAKLIAAIGAWVGIAALPWVAVFGSVLALFWALGLRLRGTRITGTLRLPFGPFLAAAGWGIWLFAG
jgi:leader peptidase (prepilin peptidase)/N-methyltransferase